MSSHTRHGSGPAGRMSVGSHDQPQIAVAVCPSTSSSSSSDNQSTQLQQTSQRLHSHPAFLQRQSTAASDRSSSDSSSDARSHSPFSEQSVSCNQVETSCFGRWLATFVPSADPPAKHAFDSATILPPISVASLSELEISHIIANARLRHDINFDRELHFRPNLDGARGREKLNAAVTYWSALEYELELYTFMLADPDGAAFRGSATWSEEFKLCQKRIPQMFITAKEILLTLMPEADRQRVEEVLDVRLMMQEIEKGVFDLARLSIWLAELLKGHCAPMRDPWVNKMLQQMSPGEHNSHATSVVEGMKELFGILEAMKLDVANHQIRYLRPMLLENTFEFERTYFTRRMKSGQIDATAARSWYLDAVASSHLKSSVPVSQSTPTTRMYSFIVAWLSVVMPTSRTKKAQVPTLPTTFKLDYDRLNLLRADIRTLMYKHICCIAYEIILRTIDPTAKPPASADATVMSLVGLIVGRSSSCPSPSPSLPHSPSSLSSSSPATFSPSDARWHAKRLNIAAELVRLAISHCAPRTRGPAERQFALYADNLDAWLESNLTTEADAYSQAADALLQNIIGRTCEAASEVVARTPSSIFDALIGTTSAGAAHGLSNSMAQYTAPSSTNGSRPSAVEDASAETGLADIVRRATQISVLHWRVWAPLLYEADDATVAALAPCPEPARLAAPAEVAPSRPLSTGSLENRLFRLQHGDE